MTMVLLTKAAPVAENADLDAPIVSIAQVLCRHSID